MAKKNYYGVRCGRQTGIFTSWVECKALVTGYPGAEFKGFVTREEAEEYMNGYDTGKMGADDESQNIPESGVRTEDTVIAYVDGSYDHSIRRYSYGCILFLPDGEVIRDSAYGNDPELLEFRNVTGEVQGAMHAVAWCLEHGYSSLEICHDYQGIASWATKAWKTNNALTSKYVEFMQNAMKSMQISFRKIAAHTGDTYNEEADQLAKAALKS
ncbi:MAG: ribonuclease H family protein [Lachnospiraceae bacterium]|nr:ribonuclease H family protein [Lachnospiraceae bacterium]